MSGHWHFTKTTKRVFRHSHPDAPAHHIHGMVPAGGWARTRPAIEARLASHRANIERVHRERQARRTGGRP